MTRDRGGPALALQLLKVPVTDMSEAAEEHPSVALFGEEYKDSIAPPWTCSRMLI